jgi:hypothetical protein
MNRKEATQHTHIGMGRGRSKGAKHNKFDFQVADKKNKKKVGGGKEGAPPPCLLGFLGLL